MFLFFFFFLSFHHRPSEAIMRKMNMFSQVKQDHNPKRGGGKANLTNEKVTAQR